MTLTSRKLYGRWVSLCHNPRARDLARLSFGSATGVRLTEARHRHVLESREIEQQVMELVHDPSSAIEEHPRESSMSSWSPAPSPHVTGCRTIQANEDLQKACLAEPWDAQTTGYPLSRLGREHNPMQHLESHSPGVKKLFCTAVPAPLVMQYHSCRRASAGAALGRRHGRIVVAIAPQQEATVATRAPILPPVRWQSLMS